LNPRETLEREPSLESAGLTGGAVYYDASTDDARLTVANALAAQQSGAIVASHALVTGILRSREKAVGATVSHQYSGETDEVRSRVIVNATGVWDNGVLFNKPGRHDRGSKGSHISVPRERIGNRDALTLISPIDGRVMFCLPAGTQTIVGTTDNWTDESPETVHASVADVDYLLRSANSYFPRAQLTRADVVSAWAGIRPLASAPEGNPSAASREHSIVTDNSGVIHITGGKLTTYRSMAAEIVDRVQEALGRKRERSPTDSVVLPGAGRENGIARLQRDDARLSEPLVSGLPYTGAHLVYGVSEEMAESLSDLLIRRMHLAFETRDHGVSVAARAADVVASLLGWDDQTKSARVREFRQDVERMFAIG
jgi:glycerol-3-phosphate dehydrogenase